MTTLESECIITDIENKVDLYMIEEFLQYTKKKGRSLWMGAHEAKVFSVDIGLSLTFNILIFKNNYVQFNSRKRHICLHNLTLILNSIIWAGFVTRSSNKGIETTNNYCNM